MKKIIAASITASFMLMAAPAHAADPTPPSSWQAPTRGSLTYVQYKGLDCWKFGRVLRCVR